jgi:hypothetical protein
MDVTNGSARERNPRWLILALCVFTAVAPVATQSQVGGSGAGSRDTLPEHVAMHALNAYNRHDVPALQSFFDTVSVHEVLGDSAKLGRGTPQQIWAGIADYFAKTNPRAELKQHIVSGPLVVLFYDFIENGKRSPHIEVDEVRHGKIVHVWDQP